MSAAEKFTPEVWQGMIDAEYQRQNHRYETVYDNTAKGMSHMDKQNKAMNELFSTLAAPMKKLKAKALRDIAKNCYKPQHMSLDFPNEEQVLICRDDKLNKHMGKLTDQITLQRTSRRFKYQDCQNEAGNDLNKNVVCLDKYLKGIYEDNTQLEEFARKHYA